MQKLCIIMSNFGRQGLINIFYNTKSMPLIKQRFHTFTVTGCELIKHLTTLLLPESSIMRANTVDFKWG